ncbi:hypothetical protein S40288_10845 [Stachybotrys chartarum IBT 40288]|nr:hypothetical protein S40288_10845 [Stachybotrys chartarum IBT 40288]
MGVVCWLYETAITPSSSLNSRETCGHGAATMSGKATPAACFAIDSDAVLSRPEWGMQGNARQETRRLRVEVLRSYGGKRSVVADRPGMKDANDMADQTGRVRCNTELRLVTA